MGSASDHNIGVAETDDAWQDAEPLYTTLVAYNSGELCAPALSEPALFLPVTRK